MRTFSHARRSVLGAVLCVTAGLTGCKQMLQASQDGERLDADLHAAMARGDYAGIYSNADPGYREAITAEKSQMLFSSIDRKLGAPVGSKQAGLNINANTSGTTLRIRCETTFAKNAAGTETIVWRKSNGVWRLYGYNINSDDLISR